MYSHVWLSSTQLCGDAGLPLYSHQFVSVCRGLVPRTNVSVINWRTLNQDSPVSTSLHEEIWRNHQRKHSRTAKSWWHISSQVMASTARRRSQALLGGAPIHTKSACLVVHEASVPLRCCKEESFTAFLTTAAKNGEEKSHAVDGRSLHDVRSRRTSRIPLRHASIVRNLQLRTLLTTLFVAKDSI